MRVFCTLKNMNFLEIYYNNIQDINSNNKKIDKVHYQRNRNFLGNELLKIKISKSKSQNLKISKSQNQNLKIKISKS